MATLFDAMLRHQIYVEGLKRGQASNLAQTLLKLNTDIKAELANVSYANLGDMNRTQLSLLLGTLKGLADKVFNAWLNELIEWLQRYMTIDNELLRRIFAATSPDVQPSNFDKTKDGAGLWGIAKNAPIAANGLLLLPFLRGFATLGSARIVAIANMGYANRATPRQLADAITGAPTADRAAPGPQAAGTGGRRPAPGPGAIPNPLATPPGGVLGLLNRQGQAVTNTILQHAAAQSNLGVSKSAFAQYLWVSVLDEATTHICRSRNGFVYKYGEGPLPPAHINCRSSTIPFDGSGPVTMPSFTMWAKGQPVEFLNDAFDREPGSSYEGSSPVALDAFAGKFGLITA